MKNREGKPKIFNNGFSYTKSTNRGRTVYFRCTKRKGCVGSCTLSDNDVLTFKNDHNHAPDPIQLHVARAQTLLTEAANTSLNVRTNEVVTNFLNNETQGNFILISSKYKTFLSNFRQAELINIIFISKSYFKF